MRIGRKNPGIVTVHKDGMAYDIPVDADGCVPQWALVQRYQAVGDIGRDGRSDATIVYPAKVKPEDIIDWWADPTGSDTDIDGIDTQDAEIYSVPLSVRGRKKKALSRIAVIGDKKEAHRIKKVLADSFTADELMLMASDRSVFFEIIPWLSDCTGYYLRMQEGVDVPKIVLENGTTRDGIVHEAVHHLKAKDDRTCLPSDRQGTLQSARFNSMSPRARSDLITREERETVVETVVRTPVDRNPSGYYDGVRGMSPREAYLHDQRVTSNGKAKKGKQAVRTAERTMPKTTMVQAFISQSRKGER